MENNPLVSIVIVTYNSSAYVRETLESAINQTYSNTELIVTDDCSTDNTIEICQEWIRNHSGTKKRIELVQARSNTGVAGNCNRGLAATSGQWLKFIAGDDILAPTAIYDYVSFVISHPYTKHLIAKAIHFTENLKESDYNNPDIISSYLYREDVTASFQYSVIKKTFFGSGPTYFIEAKALKEVGGFDERFPMQEDYPLFIKMIGKGYKMMLLDAVTVYKRVVGTSLQYDKNKSAIFTKNHVRMVSEYKFKYREDVLTSLWKMFHYYSLWIQNLIIIKGNTYSSLQCRILYFIYKVTDPFLHYERYIRRKNQRYLKAAL